jgi:hypothetical protein
MKRASTSAASAERVTPVARMTVPTPKRPRGRPAAQHTSGLRERAWWLMRELPRFTLDDLLYTLAGPDDLDAPNNLMKYIRGLERTGVLARLQRRAAGTAKTSNGRVIWRVARDLGRQAPVWKPTHLCVWDPNTATKLPVVEQSTPGKATAQQADEVAA